MTFSNTMVGRCSTLRQAAVVLAIAFGAMAGTASAQRAPAAFRENLPLALTAHLPGDAKPDCEVRQATHIRRTLIGGVGGAALGGAIGYLLAKSSDAATETRYAAVLAGQSVSVPLFGHLSNRRCGDFQLALVSSMGVSFLGLGYAALQGTDFAYNSAYVVSTVAQIGVTVFWEQRTPPHRYRSSLN